MTTRKILIAFLFLPVFAALAGGVDIKKERGGFSATLTDKFDVSPGGELTMRKLAGDVTITGSDENQVEIVQEFFFDVDTREEAQSAFERYRARVTRSGDRIKVIGDNTSRRRYVSTSYQITVPRRYQVKVNTMGGDVRLETLEGAANLETLGGDVEVSDVTGGLDVSTAGGDINVTGFSGDADLETAGGDVSLNSARGGPFRLKTSGGEIILHSVTGNAVASTSGGDVEARQVSGDLKLSTSGGDISMVEIKGQSHLAKTSGGDLDASDIEGNLDLKTSGGDVTANRVKGDFYGYTSGGDIEIRAVSGAADISTSGGDLEIRAVSGKLTGKTSGGNINARVEGKGMLKKPLHLSTSGGDITLELPTDVKATVEAEIRIQDPFSDYTIRSDFKLDIEEETEGTKRFYKGRGSGRVITATGDINGGGPLIRLKSVDGDISIEKR